LALFGILFTACEDETIKPFEQASLEAASIELGTPSPAFFDKGDYENASTTFSINATGQGSVSVSSVDVIAYYSPGPGQANEGPFNIGSVSSLPSDFSISFSDLVENTLGLTEDDVAIGAEFTLFFEMQTSAGTIVQGGPTSARSVKLAVSCPSDLEGVYTATTTGTSTDSCCPDETTVSSEVTITADGGGNYTINDFSAGLYVEWYTIYGITGPDDSPATFSDVCNMLTIFDTTEPFNTAVTGTGSIDPATGVITYTWVNGYDDTAVVTLTPQ